MAGTNNLTAGQKVGSQTVDNFEVNLMTITPGSATSTVHAATVNTQAGQITTESLTTAAGADYTFTLTNSVIAATSGVFVSVGNGTNTGGTPCLANVTPAAGSATIIIQNIHASAAFNGTLTLNFFVSP